ncbi:heterokaryon incompatibility protein-domain-containing protein [Collybia nuda]|uniref:Heterokaryon incompatibility protein-domain-containing protein n=1 Tax=Collybia nuda TaxID=64659 RepID=A0A9P5Y5P2_9AGAR|nr:heterokaryon incompatibility protein-domain-containing protein [Collybia nuda]
MLIMSDPDNLDPDIEKLLCTRCWESVFSRKSFCVMWDGSPEGVRRSNDYKLTRDLYESILTYKTPPWEEILESAEASCSYCILLRNAIRDSRSKLALPREPLASEIIVVTVLFNMESPDQRIMITIWSENGSLVTGKSVYADPKDPASEYITARNVVWNVEDSTSYDLALKCVNDCARHERCPQPKKTTLPTRVLDCSDLLRLRLVTTNPLVKDHFGVLSYVWGGPQLHCTTMDNFNTYTDLIDPKKIPKTIRDTVIVIRKLGLRYLWVDSYCIIQDSDDDKAHELSRMRLNYRNAFITILAAKANAVSEGFLASTSPSPRFEPIRLPFWCPNGTIGTITAVRRSPNLQEPVDSRAWCLAERVLSPRMLVFSTLGLQYECQMGHVNVNGSPLGLPYSVPRLPDHAFTSEPGKDPNWQLDMCWDTILQKYTERGLTVSTDKLAALSGVAEQVHRLWPNSTYAAGLWTHQLPSALLWSQRYCETRPGIYRAPSWSWAAVDGQIVPRGMTGDAAGWRSASAGPKDSEIICEVVSGHLVLSAEVAQATWDTHDDSEVHALLPDKKSGNGLVVAGLRGLDGHVGTLHMDAIDHRETHPMQVMLAGVTKNGVPLPYITRFGQHDICGLMLVPVDKQGGNGVSTYRRIGRFTVNSENWSSNGRRDIHII